MPLKRTAIEHNSEIQDLVSWIGSPPRSPRQTHGLNESDCEVLELGGGLYLATTIDTISEELEAGLYCDPYRIGWIVAMASLSDLAAVGARPLGMLLSAEWGAAQNSADRSEVARGFSDALRKCGTYWLGGDTGRARATVLGGVALGLCDSKPLSRLGMKPGEFLCMTGHLGDGPALAIRFLLGEPAEDFPENEFTPTARLDAGIALRGLATCAMDTSDGLLQTIRTLCSLNGAGVELEWRDEWKTDLISAPARVYCEARQIPLWMLFEVEHGDYQLVVSVSEENLARAKSLVPDLCVLGRVSQTPGVTLLLPHGRREVIDPGLAHSLLAATDNDVPGALKMLLSQVKNRSLP